MVRVGLDLDNVLVSIMESAKQVFAQDLAIPQSEIIDTFLYWEPFTHRDPTVASQLKPTHSFWDREDLLLNAPPLPGAAESAWKLYEAGVLSAFITRRPPAVAKLTQAWLNNNGFPSIEAHHVGSTKQTAYYRNCKSSVCHSIGITHMVDDQVHEAITLQEAGINVILVDAPVGKKERQEYLQSNPSVPLATCINMATDMLLQATNEAA